MFVCIVFVPNCAGVPIFQLYCLPTVMEKISNDNSIAGAEHFKKMAIANETERLGNFLMEALVECEFAL